MADEKDMLGARKLPDVFIRVAAPVSIALHPSGEMDVIFVDSGKGGNSKVKKRICFSPLAASQFLDAIHAAVKKGIITFGEGQQESFH